MLIKIITRLSTIILLLSCNTSRNSAINYLGQKPPGSIPKLFAPGLISTPAIEHSSPAFSPDGSVVLWTAVDSFYHATMMEMNYENGKWSAPHKASFGDSTADDYYPSFSPDGSTLYFSSRRKMPPDFPPVNDIRIWQVQRTINGWGDPSPLNTAIFQGREYAHSITRDETLYFSIASAGGAAWNLHSSQKINGRYQNPQLLPFNINSADYEDGPYISPDETFLIFDSQRPDGVDGSIDLYIAFKDESHRWTLPVNMGPQINSSGTERFAKLSPDGKYIFFGSTRNATPARQGFDIFWVDAKIIDSLKTEAMKTKLDETLGRKIIESLDANNTDSTTQMLKQWMDLYPTSLDATLIYSSHLRKQQRYGEAEEFMNSFADKTSIGYIIEKALIAFGLNKDEEATQLVDPVLGKDYDFSSRCNHLSRELLAMNKLKVSDLYFEKAMALNPGSFPYFMRACALARMGERDRAFKALDKAVEYGGYNATNDYESNVDLQSLKTDPRWKILIAKLN